MNKHIYAMGDDPLSITFTTKIIPAQGGIKVESTMNFVTGRIKDKITGSFNEDQMKLFNEDQKKLSQDKANSNLSNPNPIPRVGNPPRFKPLGG